MIGLLVECLQAAFPGAEVRVSEDVSVSDGAAIVAEVVTESFVGYSTTKRHQLVYRQLKPFIHSGELHAVKLLTFTPEEKAI